MTTALVVAIFLFLISAAVMNYANQSLRTEAWMADRAQRSLYPIAWSTANFVLDKISGDLDPDLTFNSATDNIFVSGDSIFPGVVDFNVAMGDTSVDVAIEVSGDINGAKNNPITVKVAAVGAGGAKSEVTGQILSDDVGSPGKKIVWW